MSANKRIPVFDLSRLNTKVSGSEMDDYIAKSFFVSDTEIDDLDPVLKGHPMIINNVVGAVCVQGTGIASFNFESYTLRKGSFIVLAPGTMSQYDAEDLSDDFRMKYLVFSPDFITDLSLSFLYSYARYEPVIHLTPKDYRTVISLYILLREKYLEESHPYKKEVVQYALLMATYEFSAIYVRYGNSYEEDEDKNKLLIQSAFDLLYLNYQTERRIGFYAQKLNLTPKYLSKVLKERTGKSMLEWVFELVLFETKALLKSTDMTVAEISEYFNYPDPSSFGKFFKKNVGMTPLHYRENG